MTDTTLHTPTPWTLEIAEYTDFDGHVEGEEIGIPEINRLLFSLDLVDLEDWELCKANAAFIIQACNSHDALVEAARELTDELREARKDRQLLFDALVAIRHRHSGVFDSDQLLRFGPLTTNPADDMATIARIAFDQIMRKEEHP